MGVQKSNRVVAALVTTQKDHQESPGHHVTQTGLRELTEETGLPEGRQLSPQRIDIAAGIYQPETLVQEVTIHTTEIRRGRTRLAQHHRQVGEINHVTALRRPQLECDTQPPGSILRLVHLSQEEGSE